MSFELALKEIDKTFTADDGMDIDIRPLEAGDEKALLGFFKNLPEPEVMFFKRRVRDPEVIKQWCENIDLYARLPLLALHEGKVIAVASLLQNNGGWKRHIGRISQSILPKYRQKGIAGKLVQELVDASLSFLFQHARYGRSRRDRILPFGQKSPSIHPAVTVMTPRQTY